MFYSKLGDVQTRKTYHNSSTSFQEYSFPRKQRFSQEKKIEKTGSGYFLLPGFTSANKKKGPSFPKSLKIFRFDNEQQMKTLPAPNLYNSDQMKKSSPGFSIGARLPILEMKQYEKTPGPAAYTSPIDRSHSSPKFNKSKRFPKQKESSSPGPYPIHTERMHLILSNFKNKGQTKIPIISTNDKYKKIAQKIKKSRELQEKKKQRILTQIPSSFGKSSVLKTQKFVAFGKQMRKSWLDLKNPSSPGPGNYQIKGEFKERPLRKNFETSKGHISSVRSELTRRLKTLPARNMQKNESQKRIEERKGKKDIKGY